MKTFVGLGILFMVLSCFSCSADEKANPQPKTAIIDPRMEKVRKALTNLAPDASAKALANIQQAPDAFFTLLSDASSAGDLMRLADKSHALPTDFIPPDLVSLNSYGLSLTRKDLSLRGILMPDLLAMVAAAKSAKIELVFASSYRSWSYQKTVYERNVAQLGKKEADRVSAQPGQSQHQLGTAFDMNPIDNAFAAMPAGAWMRENAWKFGFSLSYPQGFESVTGYDWESWHFRYLGKAALLIQRDYFDDMQHYFLQFWNAYRAL